MKRITNNMMTAAAVLMIGASVASAQIATTMKAEVPFAFSAANKVTEPGPYEVRALRGVTSTMTFVLRNTSTGHAFLLVTNGNADAPKSWTVSGTPRIAFDCSSGACSLAKIWYGEGNVYNFSGPRVKSGEVQLTQILLAPAGKSE